MGNDRSHMRQTRATTEPTLQDLLDDPMTRLIMERDGVRQENLTALLAVARRRLTDAPSDHAAA